MTEQRSKAISSREALIFQQHQREHPIIGLLINLLRWMMAIRVSCRLRSFQVLELHLEAWLTDLLHQALNADMQTKLVSGRVLTLKNQRGEVVPSVLEICPLLRIDKLASCLCKACHHCSLDKVIFSPFLRSCLCTSVQEFQVLLHCFTWLNSPSCKFCNSCG